MGEKRLSALQDKYILVTICDQDSYHRNRGNKIIHHYSSIRQGKASTGYDNWEITCNMFNNIITC